MGDASSDSREGQLLAGKYKLMSRLGGGGMGEVYQAENTLIGRTVAIKLLRREHAKNPDVVSRFRREAMAANLVRHPHVVDVLDVGEDDGVPFIVQEFLRGEDLGAHIENLGGRISAEATLDLLMPVIEAVALAHSRGVIHRDIKPENVFLAREGNLIVPKLLDFGISQIRTPDNVRMTASGIAMGTPAYMSPEQIKGSHESDARTDVWALGVLLYEVLAGEYPFRAETQPALFVAIATQEVPPLIKVAPHIPAKLSQIVERCMRRTPAERYPSAAELSRDLNRFLDGDELMPTLRLSIPPPNQRLRQLDADDLRSRALDATVQVPSAPKVAAEIPELDLSAPPPRRKKAPEPEPEQPAQPPPPKPDAPPVIPLAAVAEPVYQRHIEPASGLELAAEPRRIRPPPPPAPVAKQAEQAFDPTVFVGLGVLVAAGVISAAVLAAFRSSITDLGGVVLDGSNPLVSGGFGALCLVIAGVAGRGAWHSWRDEGAQSKVRSVLLAALVGVALLLAGEGIRAAL